LRSLEVQGQALSITKARPRAAISRKTEDPRPRASFSSCSSVTTGKAHPLIAPGFGFWSGLHMVCEGQGSIPPKGRSALLDADDCPHSGGQSRT